MNSIVWLATGLKSLRAAGVAGVNAVLQQQQQTNPVNNRFIATQSPEETAAGIPPKPKRPLTPYFRFLGEIRTDLKKSNPSLSSTELAKLAGQKWESLDETTKGTYVTAYKKDMTSFGSILEKYQQSLTPEQKDSLDQFKAEKQLRKEKRERKQRIKELGKPKKPPSPFLQFLSTKITGHSGGGSAGFQEIAKNTGRIWKAMSDSEKGPYVAKYQAQLEAYHKELLKWEDLMLKQGNTDVIRADQIIKSARKGR